MVGAATAERGRTREGGPYLGKPEDLAVEVARPLEVTDVEHCVAELDRLHGSPPSRFVPGSGLDGLDVELHLHLVAHQYTTGLERDVPLEAEVLAVDLGLGA